MISFNEAYALTLDQIQPLEEETVELLAAVGCITAQDLAAKVDSPSADVSLKDGYAIRSADIAAASPESPLVLKLVGSIAAGGEWGGAVHPGEAVRILSGASLPDGADAVLAEEFTRPLEGAVQVMDDSRPGRNILRRGTDVGCGQALLPAGGRISPATVGLLAAAGYQAVPVIRRPRVAVVATGDEVLAPGQPLVQGKLFASNLFTLAAWCLRCGFEVHTSVVRDDAEAIRQALQASLEQFDAVLTSGGAWKGERDLVVKILDALGWQKVYHRVRIGPGKAVGFGMSGRKPVFCLPGGPPSNQMAFLQLGLPGLQKLAGEARTGLPRVPALLAKTLTGQADWTQFVHGRLVPETNRLVFQPLDYQSRILEMAQAEAIAMIPEGQEALPAGSTVFVQVIGFSSII